MNVWTKILEKVNMKITTIARKVATLKGSQKLKLLCDTSAMWMTPDVSKDHSVFVFEDKPESLSWQYDHSETPGTTPTQRHMPEGLHINLVQNSIHRSNSRSI